MAINTSFNYFDHVVNRRRTDSIKWNRYDHDVLPMWVADADYMCPPPIIQALHKRVDHGIFGYAQEPQQLRAILADHLYDHHRWKVAPETMVFLPGVLNALDLVYRAIAKPKDGVLVQTPIYPPFLQNPPHAGLILQCVELPQATDGSYEIDFREFEDKIKDNTYLFTLCNPHNPTGRSFNRIEVEQMAEICLKHGVVICSDEIHCDLVYHENQHIPIASLDREIADSTITLIAPSKSFNIAGLKFAAAIVPNPDLRRKLIDAKEDLHLEINSLAYTAALAAYRDCRSWLMDIVSYLDTNREILVQFVNDDLPGVHMAKPESTFLAWLDCRATGIPGNPSNYFLDHARLAVNDGAEFGAGGKGFIRLNFGCSKTTLLEGLKRIKHALNKR